MLPKLRRRFRTSRRREKRAPTVGDQDRHCHPLIVTTHEGAVVAGATTFMRLMPPLRHAFECRRVGG